MAYIHRLIALVLVVLASSPAFAEEQYMWAAPSLNSTTVRPSDWRTTRAKACAVGAALTLEQYAYAFKSVDVDQCGDGPNGVIYRAERLEIQGGGFLTGGVELWRRVRGVGEGDPGGSGVAEDFCQGMGETKARWKLVGVTSGSAPETSCYMPYPPFEGADASKGCNTQLGDSVSVPNPDGTRSWSATGIATGGICTDAPPVATGSPTQNPPPRAAENPCPSGFPGSVNGTTVCVPSVPDSGIGGMTKKETVKADGSKELTEESTECVGGQCTTTTTKKNVDAAGNQVGASSTTVVKQSMNGKCASDPGNKVCAAVGLGQQSGSGTGNGGSSGGGKGDGEDGPSSFGGDCAAGFKAVSDDAVINAMAEETFRQNCKVNPDVLSQAAGKAANEAPADAISKDNAAFESKELKDAISQEDIVGGSQCIPDKSITVAGKQFLIPLSNVCDPFRYIGYIAVAASMLLAFRIVGSNK